VELDCQQFLLSSDSEVSPAHTIVSRVSSYLAASELMWYKTVLFIDISDESSDKIFLAVSSTRWQYQSRWEGTWCIPSELHLTIPGTCEGS